MVKFEKILDGLMAYINENIMPGLNNMQEIGARLLLGEIYDSRETLKKMLMENGIIKTFGYMDEEGNVDIERLLARLKTEIKNKGELEVSVPLYGKFKFKPEDIDVINEYIKTGGRHESYNNDIRYD